jgi:hypothetical protein
MYFLFICFDNDSTFAQANDPSSVKSDSIKNGLPSPKAAMIRSIIFPGWGQWYNGKKIKAGFIFLTESSIIGAAFYWQNKKQNAQHPDDEEFYLDNRNLAFWYLGGAILLSMADAYVDAHLAGFDVSPELGLSNYDFCVRIAFNYNF